LPGGRRSGGRKRPPLDPQTPEQWQEAVDSAAAMRMIADCKMYGLLEGGPVINISRCDELLERGQQLGVMPSAPVVDLAVMWMRAINDEVKRNKKRN
jgi:hypothetical protein